MSTLNETEKVDINNEKADITNLERTASDSTQKSEDVHNARIAAFTPAQQRRIMWKIDRRLVLLLGFMYCVSLMDRTNMGIAAIAGMNYDLQLTVGSRYSLVVLVFFLTYVLLQPPAVVALRKVGPRIFLPAITILWGIVMMCFGFVTTWYQLIPLRLLLGIFEAGFFPGCAYLLSCWYTRYELQKRNAVFYLIGSMASAFAGILAYGLWQMNGLGNLGNPTYGQRSGPTPTNPNAPVVQQGGIAGWRWIFIMEGVITILVGIVGVFLICDFPELATRKSGLAIKFLNKEEADLIVAKIENDRRDVVAEKFSLKVYLRGAMDAKVWAFASLFGLTTTVTYAIAYFLPIILQQGMGFSIGAAQCLIAPPYVLAAVVMYVCAYYGDKTHLRGPFIIFNAAYGIIGLALLGFVSNVGARYFGAFLATSSANANVPAVLTFQANNIRGQWKRAFASSTLVAAGGIGGIIGSTVFRSQDAPTYRPGMYTCLIASALVIIITALLELKFMRANRRAAAGGKPIEGLEGFRYTL